MLPFFTIIILYVPFCLPEYYEKLQNIKISNIRHKKRRAILYIIPKRHVVHRHTMAFIRKWWGGGIKLFTKKITELYYGGCRCNILKL